MKKGKFLNRISYLVLVVLVTSSLTGCSVVRYKEIRDGVGVKEKEIPSKKEPTGRILGKRAKVLIDTTATYDYPLFDLQYRPVHEVKILSKVERSSESQFIWGASYDPFTVDKFKSLLSFELIAGFFYCLSGEYVKILKIMLLAGIFVLIIIFGIVRRRKEYVKGILLFSKDILLFSLYTVISYVALCFAFDKVFHFLQITSSKWIFLPAITLLLLLLLVIINRLSRLYNIKIESVIDISVVNILLLFLALAAVDFLCVVIINTHYKPTEELTTISEELGEPEPIPNCHISISLPQFQHPELKYKTDSDGILAITAKDISDKIQNLNSVLDTTHIKIHTSVDVDRKTYQDTFLMEQSSSLFQVFKDAQGFSVLKTQSVPHEAGVLSVSFSADGEYLASGSEDGNIYIWKRNGRKWTIFDTLREHEVGVLSVSFSADGEYLASGSEDKTIRIWKRDGIEFTPAQFKFKAKEDTTITTNPRYESRVRSVSFSQYRARGKKFFYLASAGGSEEFISIWNGTTSGTRGSALFDHIQYLKEPEAGVRSVSFSADGQFLASGNEDGTIHIWKHIRDIPKKAEFDHIQTLKESEAGIRSVSFSADGQFLASGNEDKTIRIWKRIDKPIKRISEKQVEDHLIRKIVSSVDSEFTRIQILKESEAGVRSVSFSADGKYLASGSEDGAIYIWHRNESKFVHIRTLQEHAAGVRSVSFSADGKYLASGSEDQIVKILMSKISDEYPETPDDQDWGELPEY